jgi:hypothetical protein
VGKKKVRSDPLLVMLTRRVGPLEAMRICTFVVAWGAVYEKLDRPPSSIQEYAVLGGSSVPTAYRDQRIFRRALPDEQTPTRLWESARTRIDVDDSAAVARLACLSVAKCFPPGSLDSH